MSTPDIVTIFDIRHSITTTSSKFRSHRTTMKPKRALPTIALATTLPTASAQTAESGQGAPTLTETLQALNDSLSTLNSYIQTQQFLFAAINGTSGITILAPSNDAMAGLFGGGDGGGGGAVTMDDLNNSDPQLVEAFWNYHVLRGVWWTSNLTAGTAGTGGGGDGSATTAANRKRKKRDDSVDGDGSGIDGNSLFIPTLLSPDITPYANVSGGQRVIARSSSSSDGGGEPVVTFYSGISGSGGGSQQITKSTITQANFNFSGGTIHIIDHVLSLPSRLNDTLASFGPFSSSSTNQDDEVSSSASSLLSLTASVGALSRANLTDIFNTKQDITIFVPSNDAWNAVGSVVSDMDENELAGIMGYHVLKGQKGKVFYSDLLMQNDNSDGEAGGSEGGEEFEKDYETVEGGTVKVRVVDGSTSTEDVINAEDDDDDDDETSGSGKQVFVNGARVVKSDVLVENGVVHVVDG
ncbi:FAS1 domain-containing protein [Neurospora intermedia]|uniref:FAS1 domain-containing protein n=1 Tax=Neurospora intermedia TaxID=5142 RepID=A0ABR3CYJ6_NEUIN